MAKRKKKSTLSEIKSLKVQKYPPSNINKAFDLEGKIGQFRGGRKAFTLALNQFIDTYETALESCDEIEEQLVKEKGFNREACQLMFPKIKSIVQDFFQDYSLEERRTLVSTFLMPEIATIGELSNRSFTTDKPLELTEEQLETFFFFWFVYQIFRDYLFREYHQFADTLWQEVDEFFFD